MTRRTSTSIALALYAVFLLTAPFLHHDLACALKTPRHCTACASSVPGSDPASPAKPGASLLSDAGRAVFETVLIEDLLLAVRPPGRSPPAAV